MEKKRSVGVTVVGWLFIILSFVWLTAVPMMTSSHNKPFSLYSEMPPDITIKFLSKISFYSIIITLVKFGLLLTTGIGILKLKEWAYYMAIVIPLTGFSNTLFGVWLVGPQFYGPLKLITWLFIFTVVCLLLVRKNCREQFNISTIKIKNLKLAPKILIYLLLIPASILIISIPIWTIYAKIRYREDFQLFGLKPQKTEYFIRDETFILNECKKRQIFDYSIYIPKTWMIKTIFIPPTYGETKTAERQKLEFDRDIIGFGSSDGSKTKGLIMMLSSKSLGEGLYLPLGKGLGLKSGYDIERIINYSSWSPVYTIMRLLTLPSGVEMIEEADTSTWKGFIKAGKFKGKKRNFYEASLYNLKGESSSGIMLMFDDGTMTHNQAKSIIASLQFEDYDKNSKSLFEKGKRTLSNADYNSAIINFMNALYIDYQNPEYAYYLALSLFKDSSERNNRSGLRYAKKILEYALKLKPDYQKAKKLLKIVENKYKKQIGTKND